MILSRPFREKEGQRRPSLISSRISKYISRYPCGICLSVEKREPRSSRARSSRVWRKDSSLSLLLPHLPRSLNVARGRAAQPRSPHGSTRTSFEGARADGFSSSSSSSWWCGVRACVRKGGPPADLGRATTACRSLTALSLSRARGNEKRARLLTETFKDKGLSLSLSLSLCVHFEVSALGEFLAPRCDDDQPKTPSSAPPHPLSVSLNQ